MRQTLFRIWLQQPWSLWTEVPGEPPFVGAAWIVLFIGAALFLYHWIRRDQDFFKDPLNLIIWGVALLGVNLAPTILPPHMLFIPVFGYGFMVLVGFTTALWFSAARAKAVGHSPDIIIDAALWVLLIGILGGRLAYLFQYGEFVFRNARGPGQVLFAAINLTEGGLVQIGGLVGGTLGFLIFCYRNKVNFFEFADIIAPAIFIGIGFGRIGCLLNGCCFGGQCDLPWAIQFPAGSVTFKELVARGVVDPAASMTVPLHPTQIYSSINGFVLAFVTAVYFWYRRYRGDVFALACILYAITRVQIEFLRSDELGQLGTQFTISQIYSMGIIFSGIAIMCYVRLPQMSRTTLVHVAGPQKTTG